MANCRRSTHSDPEAALVLAAMYQKLGGTFSILADGSRYYGRPEGESVTIAADDRERLFRMFEGLLSRISQADANMIYQMYASVAVDERKFTASIEDPRRVG